VQFLYLHMFAQTLSCSLPHALHDNNLSLITFVWWMETASRHFVPYPFSYPGVRTPAVSNPGL